MCWRWFAIRKKELAQCQGLESFYQSVPSINSIPPLLWKFSNLHSKVQLWLNASVVWQVTLSRCGKLNIFSNWQSESWRFFFCEQAIDTLGTVWRSAASGFINKIRHCYEFSSIVRRTKKSSRTRSERWLETKKLQTLLWLAYQCRALTDCMQAWICAIQACPIESY